MNEKPAYKYIALLSALYVTFAQISYVLAYKIVHIDSLLLPAGVIVFPLIYTLSDVVAEVYGYKRARRLLWDAVICGFVFAMSITLLLHLPSPHYKIYIESLGKIWRIFFAVIFGVTIGSFVNIYLISKWKVKLQGRYFWFRSFISTSVGEAAVTITVDFIAFMGVMPLKKVGTIVLTIYLFKVIYALLASFPAALVVRFLKSSEKLDVYDIGINFNPFKVKVD